MAGLFYCSFCRITDVDEADELFADGLTTEYDRLTENS